MESTTNEQIPKGQTTALSIIDAIILAETGGDPNGGYTNDPRDPGGRTIWGISERANPDLWRNGPPTREQAVARFAHRYIIAPGFDKIEDPKLQAQMVDFGVTSGPAVAIEKLQKAVGAPVDGHLGPKTLGLVNSDPQPARLSNLLALERVRMIGRIVNKNPSQSKVLNGWLSRALDFMRL
jgi:lysozyme family protein